MDDREGGCLQRYAEWAQGRWGSGNLGHFGTSFIYAPFSCRKLILSVESRKYKSAFIFYISLWKFNFLIVMAFPNYLTGAIFSESFIDIICFYKNPKFQRPKINKFCVADIQKEMMLGDFRIFYVFFTHFCSSSITKNSSYSFLDIGILVESLYSQLNSPQNVLIFNFFPKLFMSQRSQKTTFDLK